MARRAIVPATLALFGALVLCPALTSPAQADSLGDVVGALDPAIRDASIAGSWKAEGRQGVYRLVLTRGSGEAPPSRLFVQWIAVGADGVTKLERTVEIAEVGTERLLVGRLSGDTEQGGLTVFIEIAKPKQDALATYEAVVEDDGSYRFSPASN